MKKTIFLLLAGSILFACKPQEKPVTEPTVVTGEITNITDVSADVEGEVTKTGGAEVTERGICWSLAQNPTTDDNVVEAGTGLGAFTGNLIGLTPETTYYIRAYATNSVGTSYGEEDSFTTRASEGNGNGNNNGNGDIVFGAFVDGRDQTEYTTVTIGTQVWMAENLKYLPSVYKPSELVAYGKRYYVYDYDGNDVAAAKATPNYQTYGVLYNWEAAMEACPDGWHLPGEAEWQKLERFLGMDEQYFSEESKMWRGDDEGGKMKEQGTTHWNASNVGATNASGFTALPGGYLKEGLKVDGVKEDHEFIEMGTYGYWWTATDTGFFDYLIWARYLSNENAYVGRWQYAGGEGFSVRCVKD